MYACSHGRVGAAGEVFLAKWNGQSVAVKISGEQHVSFNIEEFLFEVALMCVLQHDNLLPCIAANTAGPKYMLVSPFQGTRVVALSSRRMLLTCRSSSSLSPEMGSLESILADSSIRMDWKAKFLVAEQIAAAMHHLHRHNLIHRDLKSANVLVADNWERIYVTDFGTTRGTNRSFSLSLARSLTFSLFLSLLLYLARWLSHC